MLFWSFAPKLPSLYFRSCDTSCPELSCNEVIMKVPPYREKGQEICRAVLQLFLYVTKNAAYQNFGISFNLVKKN